MRFSKWHALGNSYLLLERSELGRPLDAELARRLCDLRYGIGQTGFSRCWTRMGQPPP